MIETDLSAVRDMDHLVLRALAAASSSERERFEAEVVARARGMSWGLAHRYAGRGAELDDLRAVADAAVLGAMRRFDAERGDFTAFATLTVLGEIKKHFRDFCWTIRPPRTVQELQSRLPVAVIDLQRTGASVTTATIARHLGVATQEVSRASAARSCFSPASLDAPLSGQSGTPRVDVAVEEAGYALLEDRLVADRACRGLSESERELLRLRFFEEMTQQQIADQLGRTQMQVSRELRRILSGLRQSVEDATSVPTPTAREVVMRSGAAKVSPAADPGTTKNRSRRTP